jgi:hypothetical protein
MAAMRANLARWASLDPVMGVAPNEAALPGGLCLDCVHANDTVPAPAGQYALR